MCPCISAVLLLLFHLPFPVPTPNRSSMHRIRPLAALRFSHANSRRFSLAPVCERPTRNDIPAHDLVGDASQPGRVKEYVGVKSIAARAVKQGEVIFHETGPCSDRPSMHSVRSGASRGGAQWSRSPPITTVLSLPHVPPPRAHTAHPYPYTPQRYKSTWTVIARSK